MRNPIKGVEAWMTRHELEEMEEWKKWAIEIPFFEVPQGWKIKTIPPVTMAIVRFHLLSPSGNTYSIYFDAYDQLGCVGEPYWEVHPIENDVERFLMNEIDELIERVQIEELRRQKYAGSGRSSGT